MSCLYLFNSEQYINGLKNRKYRLLVRNYLDMGLHYAMGGAIFFQKLFKRRKRILKKEENSNDSGVNKYVL